MFINYMKDYIKMLPKAAIYTMLTFEYYERIKNEKKYKSGDESTNKMYLLCDRFAW